MNCPQIILFYLFFLSLQQCQWCSEHIKNSRYYSKCLDLGLYRWNYLAENLPKLQIKFLCRLNVSFATFNVSDAWTLLISDKISDIQCIPKDFIPIHAFQVPVSVLSVGRLHRHRESLCQNTNMKALIVTKITANI